MGVPDYELQKLNGSWVVAIDFADGVYEGYLHYYPKTQFSVQIWSDGCCYITFLSPDDLTNVFPAKPRPSPNVPLHMLYNGLALPCLVRTPCCPHCLPEIILMDIETGPSCLKGEPYILEWDFTFKKYKLNYPALCGYDNFHAELTCSGADWLCNLCFMNGDEVMSSGTIFSFPFNCDTLRGKGKLKLNDEIIIISFRPLE